MQTFGPHPLEVLLAKDTLTTGSLFTDHSPYYFVGLGKVREALTQGKVVKPAKAYRKLDEWQTGGKVTFEFHDEHLTSNSSWSELRRQKRVFVLGIGN